MDGKPENSVSSDAIKQLSSTFKFDDSHKKFFGFIRPEALLTGGEEINLWL